MQQRVTPEALGTVDTEYHRLYRAEANYRWWRPLLMLLLAGVFLLLASGAVLAVAQFIASLVEGRAVGILEMNEYLVPDTQKPMSLLLALSSIAIGIPCVFFAMWCVGIRPSGRISSVALRIRWGLMMRMLWPAVASLLFMQVAGILIGFLFPGTGEVMDPLQIDVQVALISVGLILLLVPLQAAAEEYLFRGVLMQTIGSWVRNPALAIILPTLLFMSMHIYDIWGLLQVGVMGLIAAWLAWRTGGLEAAIMIHVINNLVVFLFMATGLTGETGQTESGGNLVSLVLVTLGLVGYAWYAVRIFDRGNYSRVLRMVPQAPQPSPAMYGMPVAPGVAAYPGAPLTAAGSMEPAVTGTSAPVQQPWQASAPQYGERIDQATPGAQPEAAAPGLPVPPAAATGPAHAEPAQTQPAQTEPAVSDPAVLDPSSPDSSHPPKPGDSA